MILKFPSLIAAVNFFIQSFNHILIWIFSTADIRYFFISNFGSARLQVGRLQRVENGSSRNFLDRGNIMCPKSKRKEEMAEVETKKPDDIVDVENRFRPILASQPITDEQQKDVKH